MPAEATGAPDLMVVGRVRKAHGIRGELVIEVSTDAPDAVFAPGRRVFAGTFGDAASLRELHVHHASPFKGGLIAGFDEIADRNGAELWRGRDLLVPTSELEPPDEGRIYIHDLPGMRVELMDGTAVGTVREVFELPHGLLLDVARPGASSVLVPFHESAVQTVDAAARVIRLDPPVGLLD